MSNKVLKQDQIFNKRAFISIAMFSAGLFLPISGIMNHWLQFEPLTMERHFWMSVHNISAILFIILVIIHISYNWRVLTHYAMRVTGILISKEALTAIVLVILVVGLFSSHAFQLK